MVLWILLILSLLRLQYVLTWAGGQVLYPVTIQCYTGLKSHKPAPSVEVSYCFSAALLNN